MRKPFDDPNVLTTFKPKNKLRFVTATALFDGHDASINIIRRLLQARGVEVIHLGHNRTAKEVALAAIDEDAHGLALSSYQGGHMEYFRYVREILDREGGDQIRIFGGGGGVITPEEIISLESQGISRIFSPEDGQTLGLHGMTGAMIQDADRAWSDWGHMVSHSRGKMARGISLVENGMSLESVLSMFPDRKNKQVPVLGVTGTGGSGKSSLLDEILLRCLWDFPQMSIGLICIDPTKKKTGGALLGDRLRMNSCDQDRIYLRSLASRQGQKGLSDITKQAIQVLKAGGCDFIIVESSGIGQGDSGILDVCDGSLYVMTAEYGASSQLEKIDMLDYAQIIAINKFEQRQGPDAYRDVCQQLRRSRYQGIPQESYPVYGTIASRFLDDGVNGLYRHVIQTFFPQFHISQNRLYSQTSTQRHALIPGQKQTYLSDISRTVKSYKEKAHQIYELIILYENLEGSIKSLTQTEDENIRKALTQKKETIWKNIPEEIKALLSQWDCLYQERQKDEFTYSVRKKSVQIKTQFESLARLLLPKVAMPHWKSLSELTKWLLLEHLPGYFPFTAGIYPYKRTTEDPKRQFAGEGGPQKTNQRFHFLCQGEKANRLSTAFDSVTLYGADPHKRPDIYGKIGESGVSIAHLEDMKLLYKGFDLCDPQTSISMTINGPAPVILAMFFQTAISQQIEQFTKEHKKDPSADEYLKIKEKTLKSVRGTVQADILKEDQAQNTCLFSIDFALKMMGDIQEYFVKEHIRNYYAVSISGYHIAEAGANPITQLALTLANGFTYVEYYLARGLAVDDFAPNLSFFFSNGLDPEYTVLGRVARRIWAITMRDRYGANIRSQQLKYHIQTSGRSLHAQEMDFNDIRTTLQALMALLDQCNSLHTNAYDEALTTPTEASVRRAMAIQLIITSELGLAKCENFHQGSFFVETLHNLVEEAVLQEFERISERGGVLGAMETQYQRSKIQEESLYYEHLKHQGEFPIVGVNTYQNPKQKDIRSQVELTRSSYEEKDQQIKRLQVFHALHKKNPKKEEALNQLARAAALGENTFEAMMEAVLYASLGEICELLMKVGGRYRRSC